MQTAKKAHLRTEPSDGNSATGRSLLECIGNTPLLRLERIGKQHSNAEFYAKAEWANPGGSVKDRPALEMIRDAYRMVKRAAREEGLLLSPSAAGALDGCFQVAAALKPNERAVIITILADSAAKYLSERFWDEE